MKNILKTNKEKNTKTPEHTMSDIIELLKKHKIPEHYGTCIEDYAIIDSRPIICKLQGFCLVSQTWIDALAKYIGNRNVLEVMCGCGSISHSLQQKGINILPTDNFSWGDINWNINKNYWTNIVEMDAVEAIKLNGKNVDIIIMSWPPYMDDIAYRVLCEMRRQNPNCVMIYIGEGYGGCTADDNFHESMIKIDDEKFSSVIETHESWFSIHDQPYLIR